jgi:hypothetical protein
MISAPARFTTVPGQLEVVTYVPQGDPPQPPPFEQTHSYSAYTPYYERYTPNSFGDKRQWKPFDHYKSVQSAPTSQGMPVQIDSPGPPPNHSVGFPVHIAIGYDKWYLVGTTRPFGDYGSLDDGLPAFNANQSDGGFIPNPDGLDSRLKTAMSSILPIVKSELSLPNFIYELKDFKRPAAKVVAVLRQSSFKAALKKLGLTKQSLTFKQLLKGAAGQYLNTQFNILPLISDIGKITNALSRTERRLNDFITREGRPQNRHYVYSWQEYPDVFNEGTPTGSTHFLSAFGRTDCFAERKVTYSPSRFHVQVQFNYNYTGYQRENARWLAYLDAFGIQLNPAIIWNAIPWTFVVDWVAGIGPWLDSMKVSNLEPQINIRRFLWSIKRRREIVVTKGTYANSPTLLLQRKQMPMVVQTAYRRSTYMPDASSIQLSGLTPTEFSLGAALVIARKRR